MSSAVCWIIRIAWAIFALINGLLFIAGHVLPTLVALLLLLPALLAWAVLLAAYNRALGQWRAVLVAWIVFGLLRAVSTAISSATVAGLAANAASLVVVLCLCALLAGYATLIALVARRDVSVAYITIFYAVGGITMFWMVHSAGGVANFFDSLLNAAGGNNHIVGGSLLLSLSCMSTLGFIALVPHMIIMAVREIRGN